jgi:hypothetical protein
VTTQPSPTQTAPIGAIALLLLAAILYFLFMFPVLDNMSGGDPAASGGEGRYAAAWSQLFALLFGGSLWAVLGLLLLLGRTKGEMPHWAAILAGLLFPLSGIAAAIAVEQSYVYPGGWSFLVPVLLPPLIALYAMWARLPAIHAALQPEITSSIMLGMIGALTIAPFPLSSLDQLQAPARWARQKEQSEALAATRAAEWASQKHEDDDKFQQLTPYSPLRDYLDALYFPYPYPEGAARHEQAVAGARQVKTRQAEAVTLLNEGKIGRLEDLWGLALEATPALCDAYGAALHRYATRDITAGNAVPELERQLPNMRWLAGQHCNLDNGLAAVATVLQRSIDASGQNDRERFIPFKTGLAELRQPR